jgi:hypothetical protein
MVAVTSLPIGLSEIVKDRQELICCEYPAAAVVDDDLIILPTTGMDVVSLHNIQNLSMIALGDYAGSARANVLRVINPDADAYVLCWSAEANDHILIRVS